ncbi:MAG: FAD-binding oxidoreductase [Candidatus Protistobacter heckmanni]|nr:FAD-binding oxidoreductase [Candidatus Protistobacter heckmanni]
MTASTAAFDAAAFLAACAAIVGEVNVITDRHDQEAYTTDWRKRYIGAALAVLRPGSTEEVAALVKLCAGQRVAIVPQGGNTGLCGGATPDDSGAQVVLSLKRMNRVRQVDTLNQTLVAEAGCILKDIQQVAAEHARQFSLSLAAEGSCTIGGVLSTNAGGTAVLRYGNARDLCLGLEVVTAQGEIWNGLRGLRKDNTGYDLRDLFIGAEGTLGIITAAVLKLVPAPAARLTALASVPDMDTAVKLLELAQARAGMLLTGFEVMSDYCLRLVNEQFPQLRHPFPNGCGQAVLLELSDQESEDHARGIFDALMKEAIEAGLVEDALIAQSLSQAAQFWSLREHIPLAQAQEGKNIKHDVALPASRLAEFVAVTSKALLDAFPGARLVVFGHLGDGNLHYNLAPPVGVDPEGYLDNQEAINRIVHDSVHRHGGSISAEHGIGKLKVEEIRHYKNELELRMMAAIKQALDPQGLLNPGKVLLPA